MWSKPIPIIESHRLTLAWHIEPLKPPHIFSFTLSSHPVYHSTTPPLNGCVGWLWSGLGGGRWCTALQPRPARCRTRRRSAEQRFCSQRWTDWYKCVRSDSSILFAFGPVSLHVIENLRVLKRVFGEMLETVTSPRWTQVSVVLMNGCYFNPLGKKTKIVRCWMLSFSLLLENKSVAGPWTNTLFDCFLYMPGSNRMLECILMPPFIIYIT